VRLATPNDTEQTEALMKASIREIFPHFYAPEQIEPCIRYIGHLDTMLVDDGTYFVEEDETGLIACGGWSRRYKLYAGSAAVADDARLLDPATEAAPVRAMFVRGDRTRRGLGTRIFEACEQASRVEGFTKLALMATLPGVPLYLALGFEPLEEVDIPLEDGTIVAGVRMERPVRGGARP
jgi:GNAT superfamily N-acetyltransferase